MLKGMEGQERSGVEDSEVDGGGMERAKEKDVLKSLTKKIVPYLV